MKPCQSNKTKAPKQGRIQGTKWKDPPPRRQKNHIRGPTTSTCNFFKKHASFFLGYLLETCIDRHMAILSPKMVILWLLKAFQSTWF